MEAIGVFARHGHVLAAAHAASFHDEAVERYYRHGFLQAFVDAVGAPIRAENAAGRADVPDPKGVATGLVLMNASTLTEAFGRPDVDPPASTAETNLFIWERVIYG